MATAEPTGLGQDERRAIARLRALLELLPAALDRRLHDLGLTAFEYTLLEALGEAHGRRLRLSALASRTNASLPRLSRVVSGLERKGLLVKEQCPADARATNAVLTPAGEQAWSQAAPVYGAAVREIVIGGLDTADVDELARLCLAMLQRLDPGGRMVVTMDRDCHGDPEAFPTSPSCGADPETRSLQSAPAPCGSDPEASSSPPCESDPRPTDASRAPR